MSERIRRLLEGFLSQDLDVQNQSLFDSLVLLEMRVFGPAIPAKETEHYRLLAPEVADAPPLMEEEEAELLLGLVDLFLATRRSGLLFLIGKARLAAAAPAFGRLLNEGSVSLSNVEARDILVGLNKGTELDPEVAGSLRTPGMKAFLKGWSEASEPDLAGIGRRLDESIFGSRRD
jgi:hypothetical protein